MPCKPLHGIFLYAAQSKVPFRFTVDNGAVVTFIDGIYDYAMAIEHRFIDGVEFVYGSGKTLLVFYGGELYSLETAYERGIVSRDELVRIFGRQNNGY